MGTVTEATQTTNSETPSKDTIVLLEFLYRLGQAYLASGEQTAQVELIVRRIATVYGMRKARVVAFPTAIFISVNDGQEERITLAEGPISGLRLDQIADVYTLGSAVQSQEVTPADGLAQLSAILRKPARFGSVWTIAGHGVISVGLAMVLMPTMPNLISAAVLGTFIGGLKVLKKNKEVLAVPLSVVSAILVSFIVFKAFKYGVPFEPLHALVPPLVTFLPGAMLAMGMVELAYGDMVSGSARLLNGFVQLVLLAFGLAAGAALAGMGTAATTVADTEMLATASWMPWLGVILFGIGIHIHFSAPKKSLGWLHLVLLTTFAAQQASAGFIGKEFSGFFGALVATPLVYLIQLKFKGPPAMVTFLPSFWLLVPGALGLVSVKRLLSNRDEGLDGLTAAVFVFAAIALGTLMGASVYKWLSETFAGWQLQIGRAVRPAKKKPAAAAAKAESAPKNVLGEEEAEEEAKDEALAATVSKPVGEPKAEMKEKT